MDKSAPLDVQKLKVSQANDAIECCDKSVKKKEPARSLIYKLDSFQAKSAPINPQLKLPPENHADITMLHSPLKPVKKYSPKRIKVSDHQPIPLKSNASNISKSPLVSNKSNIKEEIAPEHAPIDPIDDFDFDNMGSDFLNDLDDLETQFNLDIKPNLLDTRKIPGLVPRLKSTENVSHKVNFNAPNSHLKLKNIHGIVSHRIQTPLKIAPIHTFRKGTPDGKFKTPLSTNRSVMIIEDTPQSVATFQTPHRKNRRIEDTQSNEQSVILQRVNKRIHETPEEVSMSSPLSRNPHNPIQVQNIRRENGMTRKTKRLFVDDEAELSEGERRSSDEDERYMQQDLSGFVVGNVGHVDTSLAFYRRGLDTQQVVEERGEEIEGGVNRFGERAYGKKLVLNYHNQCSSPFFKSDEMSELGSMVDFVVNDSQGGDMSMMPLSSDYI